MRGAPIRAWLMCGAATSLALLVTEPAAAQAQPAATGAPGDANSVEAVVVTGIRGSIEKSIAVKKQAASIVEVISAEDIGKLPDVSIAESLARLPGVTTQRLDGRAQVISIRGLGPDFTTALLNGREQVSTGDNRGVEFDQYPAELLNQVVVYKTPDAALVGQALGGTVDMRTVKPLEFGHRAIALNARYEWNDIGALNAGTTDHGWRYTASIIDQFMDGKLGVALGYAHLSSPYQAERFNAWGYPNADPANKVIGGAKPYVMSSKLDRDGFMGVVEFSPNDRLTSTVDAFYSKFKNTQILRGIEFPLYWSSAQLQPGYTASNGLVVSGQFNGVKGVVRNDANQRDAKLFAIGWNTVWHVTDNWSAVLDASYSKVDRKDLILETYSGTSRGGGNGPFDNMGFVSTDSGTRFTSSLLNYGDYNLIQLTSPQGWGGDVLPGVGGQDGYYNNPSIKDDLKAVRLSATRNFSDDFFLSSVDVGVNLNHRTKSLDANEFFLSVVGAPANASIPQQYRLGETSLAFMGLGGMVSYDPIALVHSGIYNFVRNPNADVVTKSWNVAESVDTGYVRANVRTEMFGRPLTGNVGVQFVHTDQHSNAFAAMGTGSGVQMVPTSGGDKYNEVLPSANLILQLGDDQFLRLAAARVMARPRMDQMNASFQYSFDSSPGKLASTDINNSPWGGSGGNPKLRPLLAKAVDVSYERYFGGRQGYVSLAAYYKDLETYVFDQISVRDFTGYPTGGATPALFKGLVTTPQNGKGGTIYGAELTVSVPFSLVSDRLDGFGAEVSASTTHSKVHPDPNDPSTPLPGLSRNVLNATLYYERYGFQARISSRTRSSFLGEVAGFGNGRTYRMVKGETVVDGQVGYEFQEGPLKNLSVLLQVENLTDEPFVTFESGDQRRVIDYQRYGRSYLFGVNYKF